MNTTSSPIPFELTRKANRFSTDPVKVARCPFCGEEYALGPSMCWHLVDRHGWAPPGTLSQYEQALELGIVKTFFEWRALLHTAHALGRRLEMGRPTPELLDKVFGP